MTAFHPYPALGFPTAERLVPTHSYVSLEWSNSSKTANLSAERRGPPICYPSVGCLPGDSAKAIVSAKPTEANSSGKGTGGSIPAVVLLRNVMGIDSLLMGFALDDDGAHSPNEEFEQRCFHRGIHSHVRLLAKFAGG